MSILGTAKEKTKGETPGDQAAGAHKRFEINEDGTHTHCLKSVTIVVCLEPYG
jgi:hypothetical protein